MGQRCHSDDGSMVSVILLFYASFHLLPFVLNGSAICIFLIKKINTSLSVTPNSNFGKLNYHLGKRAAKEGRDSAYPEIDFCKVRTR